MNFSFEETPRTTFSLVKISHRSRDDLLFSRRSIRTGQSDGCPGGRGLKTMTAVQEKIIQK